MITFFELLIGCLLGVAAGVPVMMIMEALGRKALELLASRIEERS